MVSHPLAFFFTPQSLVLTGVFAVGPRVLGFRAAGFGGGDKEEVSGGQRGKSLWAIDAGHVLIRLCLFCIVMLFRCYPFTTAGNCRKSSSSELGSGTSIGSPEVRKSTAQGSTTRYVPPHSRSLALSLRLAPRCNSSYGTHHPRMPNKEHQSDRHMRRGVTASRRDEGC